jgi:uncharacterized protein (TIGR04255 family)
MLLRMTPLSDAFFPSSPRVIYEKTPLTQVICQLRFPPLLRIEGEPPADFQERIRSLFPLFERTANVVLPDLPAEIVQLLGPGTGGTNYNFRTEDKTTSVSLQPGSISLSTTTYSRWEEFCRFLDPPLSALLDIYKPSFFIRIGLRYSNAIQRSRFGLDKSRWSELLRPEVLGELSLPEFEDHLQEVKRSIRIKVPEQGSIFFQHGLGVVAGQDERSYLIDFDFYTDQKTQVEHARPTLDRFNHQAGRAFRWCITDTLHRSMGPTELA